MRTRCLLLVIENNNPIAKCLRQRFDICSIVGASWIDITSCECKFSKAYHHIREITVSSRSGEKGIAQELGRKQTWREVRKYSFAHSNAFTIRATCALSTGFPSSTPSAPNRLLNIEDTLTVPFSFFLLLIVSVMISVNSSWLRVSIPDAYSSRTVACAISLSRRSARFALANSSAADFAVVARLRSSESNCISVLNGEEVLEAFVISARIALRTSKLHQCIAALEKVHESVSERS